MEETTITLQEFFQIVKRRKGSILAPFLLIFITGMAVALLLPSYYKAESTILIENQEIPSDFVMATITSFAEQRLQTINQRIMSTTKLIELIEQFQLYPDLRKKWTLDEIVEKMRDDITMETISTDVIDRRTGRPTSATIAFTLSYMGKQPETVQKVTNTLTSLFLQENLDVRQRQTLEATRFLEEEMNRIKKTIEEQDQKISEFKNRNASELPEMLQANLQGLNAVEQTATQLIERLRNLREREGYLQTQLSAIQPDRQEDFDRQRIEELKVKLVSLKTRFSDEYPDVIKLKAEIEELENQKALKKTKTPDNPTYISVASQLAGVQSEIRSINRQIEDLDNKRDMYRKRIEKTHGIEGSYNELIVERSNAKIKYEDLMRKVMEAEMAHGLEKEQKGERFTLIDSPRLPEKPFKPNRLAIILVGFVLGCGAGIGFGALMEFSDDSIRSSQSLEKATSFPVLAVLPLITTQKELSHLRRKRIALVSGVLGSLVLSVLLFHFLYMDLYVFWARLMRKIAL